MCPCMISNIFFNWNEDGNFKSIETKKPKFNHHKKKESKENLKVEDLDAEMDEYMSQCSKVG